MAGEDEPRILSVKSEVLDSGIMVAVADSGKGIAPQNVGRIFNPLFTTKSDGMGMGLSICCSIIEAHDGDCGLPGIRREAQCSDLSCPLLQPETEHRYFARWIITK
jgi:nitrogen fixation/metabolism regulation signal transduction histidine kinase